MARTELDDCRLRASRVAVVAFETVAAGQTASRFVVRFSLAQAGCGLHESAAEPLLHSQLALERTRRVGIDRQFELIERDHRMLGDGLRCLTAQPGVDVTGGLLAMPDCRGDGAFAWDHVAAGEDAGVARHHAGVHDHRYRPP